MTKGFRGGIPWTVDVNRLREAFANLPEGRVIKHEELEPVVRAPKGSARYYGVVNSWIKWVRSNLGIYLEWKLGIGIKVLNPAEIMELSEVKTKQKVRQTGRSMGILGYSDRDRLDDIGQKRWDHDHHVYGVMTEALRTARKDLRIDLAPVKSLPKPKLVTKCEKCGHVVHGPKVCEICRCQIVA